MADIYVVEDDQNIREIESFALKNSGYKVKSFECAKDFYTELQNKVPSLILLDIMLPDEDGLQIVERLRSHSSTRKVPIIIVTAKTTEIDKVKGLDIGADDYITKPFGVMELVSRVKAVLRRTESLDSSQSIKFKDIYMDNDKHVVYINEQKCELTFKEYELLNLLMLNVGIVLSRDTIMQTIWSTDFESESRTLDMHIKTLRQKLKDSSVTIKTVRNVGYMLE